VNTPPTLTNDVSLVQQDGVYDVLRWKQGVVGTDPGPDGSRGRSQPYLFYLEKGSHVLQMRPVLGAERVKIKRDIEAVRNEVSGPFQQVKEVLGQYASLEEAVKAKLDLRVEMPDLSAMYTRAVGHLDAIKAEIMAIVPPGLEAKARPTIAQLEIVKKELESVARDPNVLLAPEQFDTGYAVGSADRGYSPSSTLGAQGNFEARVINLLSGMAPMFDLQTVETDWIAFMSLDVKLHEPVAPWFFTIQWVWREFLRSFTQ
jgi:hypothetical protein